VAGLKRASPNTFSCTNVSKANKKMYTGYNVIKSAEVEKAMLAVDRAQYCLAKDFAYHDSPQSIGKQRFTLLT